MKKILLPLFLIATSMTIIRLSAYCTYNKSNEKIYINIYKKRPGMFTRTQAYHTLNPGGKKCWNWKEIDKKNRKREYYWIASSKRQLGEGYFPIGSAIVFKGYDTSGRAIFNIHFGPNPKSMPLWNYRESPWNHRSQPWKTYKRK